MSGNDSATNGQPLFDSEQIKSYMDRFALPVAARIVELRKNGLDGSTFSSAVEAYVHELLGSGGV